jgi:OOP family OmpA-OmpF porin
MLKPFLASLAMVSTVIAAPAGAQMRTPDTHFYGGFGLGRTDNNAGTIDKKDEGWKLYGGYQINRNFAAEGGYVDLGQAAIPGAVLDTTAWYAFAVGILPINEQFGLFGKLGLAMTETDTSGIGTTDTTAPAFGLGLRYFFTPQFGIRGEWERFRAPGTPFSGKSDVDYYSISAVFRFR